ncbi:MAG: cyclic nucleotide-binding domain-containing protein [Verrucomicrobiota bacterium]
MTDHLSRPELPNIGIVADMDEDERRLLSSYGEFLPGHKDSVIIQQGEPQNSLFLIISGLLHVHTEADGRKLLLGSLKAGDMLGEINIFDPAEASATVTAVEFSQIWRINRDMLEDFLNDYPAEGEILLIQICTQLSQRLRATNQKLADAQETNSQSSSWS